MKSLKHQIEEELNNTKFIQRWIITSLKIFGIVVVFLLLAIFSAELIQAFTGLPTKVSSLLGSLAVTIIVVAAFVAYLDTH